MMYLGTPGRMVKLKCPVSQRDTTEEGYRFVTTLEGRRKAQVVPGQRRVWDISAGRLTTPAELGTLREFASGAWGPGPFWFVPEAAAEVNLLSLRDSLGAAETTANVAAGPLRLDDGSWAPESLAPGAGSNAVSWRSGVAYEPPVLPSISVTGSAWVLGSGAYVMLQWLDATGSIIGSVSSSTVNAPTRATRVAVTATPPTGAVQVRLTARDVLQAVRPAVTWTDTVMEWGEGQGCPKAVISQTSRDLVRAIPGMAVLADVQFTVTEVG